MGPNYANLFVGYVEEQIFNQFDGPKPELFGRYIDDCLGATSCTKEELERFIIRPSNSHGKSLKPQSLFSISTFLSKTTNWQPVSTTNPQIRTVTYCTRLPTHLTSKTQFRTPNFSDSVGSASKIQTLTPNATKCRISFPNVAITILSKALNRVQNVNRESALEPSASDNEERIPFTLTFHPNNLAARNAVLRNFKILQSDPETAPIFPNLPLVSFKRDRNLRNSLVRSSLPSNLEPGTFRCSRKVCNTCPFINSKTHIQGPNGLYQVNDHFGCATSNIIYCITCTLCNKLYIGESGRKLGDRFREHLLDVKSKGSDLSKPVARHFNLPGHSHEHMEICGIYLHLGNNETRKRKEQRLIFKLGTLAPNGINERFSFA